MGIATTEARDANLPRLAMKHWPTGQVRVPRLPPTLGHLDSATMRAVTIGDQEISVEEHPDPEPGKGEVLVACAPPGSTAPTCCSARRLSGAARAPHDIPGLEMAGEVRPTAPGDRFSEGDRVMAMVGGGGQAELAIVHERLLMPVPDALDWPRRAASRRSSRPPTTPSSLRPAWRPASDSRPWRRRRRGHRAFQLGRRPARASPRPSATRTARAGRELGADVIDPEEFERARPVRRDPRARRRAQPPREPRRARARRPDRGDRRRRRREGRAQPPPLMGKRAGCTARRCERARGAEGPTPRGDRAPRPPLVEAGARPRARRRDLPARRGEAAYDASPPAASSASSCCCPDAPAAGASGEPLAWSHIATRKTWDTRANVLPRP